MDHRAAFYAALNAIAARGSAYPADELAAAAVAALDREGWLHDPAEVAQLRTDVERLRWLRRHDRDAWKYDPNGPAC